MRVVTTEQRFWAKVVKTDTCWLWIGAKRSKGYGAFVYVSDGQVVQGRAHRFSYELHVGPIPPNLNVLHHCDTPACVRPDHLFIGTKAENNLDMIAKGRHVPGGTYGPGRYKRGSEHPNARLTPDAIRAIRQAREKGWSFRQISRHYGFAIAHVFRIINHRAWKHVD